MCWENRFNIFGVYCYNPLCTDESEPQIRPDLVEVLGLESQEALRGKSIVLFLEEIQRQRPAVRKSCFHTLQPCLSPNALSSCWYLRNCLHVKERNLLHVRGSTGCICKASRKRQRWHKRGGGSQPRLQHSKRQKFPWLHVAMWQKVRESEWCSTRDTCELFTKVWNSKIRNGERQIVTGSSKLQFGTRRKER